MSGFSAEWLALREPADHRARDAGLLAELARHFGGRPVSVLDLGCGAGSNLRGMAHALGDGQRWRLVDYDPALLAHARDRLAAWGGGVADAGGLAISAGSGRCVVAFEEADLSGGIAPLIDPAPDLVTAAAFFDLVSEDWIDRFAAALAAHRLPFYTVLTYDGVERWSPPHALDAAVLAAFHAHQGRDKGFGPAAGPGATARLAEAFRAHGYRVLTAPSPWDLGLDDAKLISELAKGIATAAVETGRVSAADGREWAQARREARAVVGHQDLLALPG